MIVIYIITFDVIVHFCRKSNRINKYNHDPSAIRISYCCYNHESKNKNWRSITSVIVIIIVPYIEAITIKVMISFMITMVHATSHVGDIS